MVDVPDRPGTSGMPDVRDWAGVLSLPDARVRADLPDAAMPDAAVLPDSTDVPDAAEMPDSTVRPDSIERPDLTVRPDSTARPDSTKRPDSTARSDSAEWSDTGPGERPGSRESSWRGVAVGEDDELAGRAGGATGSAGASGATGSAARRTLRRRLGAAGFFVLSGVSIGLVSSGLGRRRVSRARVVGRDARLVHPIFSDRSCYLAVTRRV